MSTNPQKPQDPEAWGATPPIDFYGFDPISKLYIGITPAYPSPLEPGHYPPPANATDTPPPALEVGQVALYENGAWLVCPDKRGKYFVPRSLIARSPA